MVAGVGDDSLRPANPYKHWPELHFKRILNKTKRKSPEKTLQSGEFQRVPREWLKQHENDRRVQMEDQFFLPAVYERLRAEFGSRVIKKPERFGGEIDIMFDDTIPIELKVRRGQREPLDTAEVDAAFPATGQAAAYAAISRLGFVIVLDLPDGGAPIANLEACAKVVERRFPKDSAYPTSIVLIVFRGHQGKPSEAR